MQISTEAGWVCNPDRRPVAIRKIEPQQLRREHSCPDRRWLLRPRLAGPAAEGRRTEQDGRDDKKRVLNFYRCIFAFIPV